MARSASMLCLVTAIGASLAISLGCGSERATETPAAVEPNLSAEPVTVGLDVVQREGHPLFEDRRIGLVVHGASVSSDGTHAIDVFEQRGYNLVRLFSPEHGLRGKAAAGESVADGTDDESGLPIVSFYGPRTKPEPEHLSDLDVLVIDLQDVGVRFYTYVSTMLLSAEAGLAAGLDVVILDRPNPLGGVNTSGPLREAAVPLSMVSRAPGSLVHGLTVGELARVAFPVARTIETASAGRVYVVPMEGWQRDMVWGETGLSWINPSPNLRSAAAASLYPSTAFFESVNVSEGRGTESPFSMIGAPWFTDDLVADLASIFSDAGVASNAIEFTPKSSPAASNPKFVDQLCLGLSLEAGPRELNHYALGVRLLARLSSEQKFEMLREGEALTWLLGSGATTAVLRRDDLDQKVLTEHLERVSQSNQEWRAQRDEALLYE